MKKFAEKVIQYRLPIIITTSLLTVLVSFGLARVSINTDLISYLNPEDPDVMLFDYVGEQYGGNNIIMLAVEGDDIFSNEALVVVRDITEYCKTVSGVMSVTSLTDVLDMKNTDYGLEIARLIDRNNIPSDSLELETLREYTLGKEMYAGKIVSEDSHTTLITVRTHPDADDAELVNQIRIGADSLSQEYSIYYGGLPVQIQEIGQLLTQDISRLIPIVVLVVLLVLFLGFRSLRAVVLPLAIVIISAVWTIGIMGWAGVALSMVSNITPIVLVAVGSAYGIHFVARYREDVDIKSGSIRGTQSALEHVGVPILLAGGTTLIGFFSLVIGGSTLTAIADFGLFTAIGVGIATILSVTFLPAILSLLPVKKPNKKKTKSATSRSRLGKFEAELVLRRKSVIIVSAIILTIVCLVQIPKLQTQVNMLEYFPEDSEIRQTSDLLQDRFGSSLPFQVVISGDIREPLVLEQMLKVGKYLQSLPDVGNTQSVADMVAELNSIITGKWTIPETRAQVANLLFLLEGEEVMTRLVNDSYSEALIYAQFSSLNSGAIVSTTEKINSYLESEFETALISVEYDELSMDQQATMWDYVLNETVENISNDAVGCADPVEIDKEILIGALYDITSMPPPGFTEENLSILQDRFTEYLLWQAPVIIDSDSIVNLAVFALMESIDQNNISSQHFQTILAQVVPEVYYEDNPDDLMIAAEYASALVFDIRDHSLNTFWQMELQRTLQNEQIWDMDFVDDVHGDLWALRKNSVGIPSNLIADIQGDQVNFQVQLSGMLPVFTTLNSTLISSQSLSLVVAFALIFVLMALRFRSPLMGLIIASPLVFTVIINFGVMSFAGVSLDIATVMVGSISIGIGVDYAIHASSRFQKELKRTGNEEEAMKTMISTTGKSIFLNATTVGLGFLVLTWSNVLPIRRFGWLIALTMLVSMIASLTLLPALILSVQKHLHWTNSTKHEKGD